MKTFVFLFCTLSFALGAKKGFSQDAKIVVEKDKEISIKKVFKLINQQTDYQFVYRHDLLKDTPKIQLKKGVIKASVLLKQCLSPINFTYEFTENRTILVKKNNFKKESRVNIKTVEIKINGIITDKTGEPLPGASVLEKGTSNGVSTDFDGNFSISVADENAILVVSYIGYASKEFPVLNKTQITIILKEDAAQLDEIVIIGYGSVAKKDLTGSVGVVDNIAERPVTTTAEGLQGSVAGVTVIANGGDPTGTPVIKIRGVGTFNQESPLWVVDGVPYYGGPINPFDIESMTILKDASSQAIYGVKAAGGVILVTTKKGKNGKLALNFNNFVSMQNPEKPKALSVSQAQVLSQLPSLSNDLQNEYAFAGGKETNWIDEVFRTGITKNYDIGARGGNEKITFASSIGYNKKEGTLINTQADRVTFRLNTSFKVNDKLKIGENFSFTRTQGNSAFTGTSDENGTQNYDGIIAAAIKADPRTPVYKGDGITYSNLPTTTTINPVATLNRLDIKNINQDLFANIYFDYTILDGLKLKSSFGINSKTNDFKEFTAKRPEFSKTQSGNNSLDYATSEQVDWSLETTLNYNKTFSDVHNFAFLAGHTLQRFQREAFGITGRTFPSELNSSRDLINANEFTIPKTTYGANSLMSYFGRVVYGYDGKYLLTASVRTDGSSKLKEENKWGVFPAVALGWKASEESFLIDNETVSNLKLRASWGIIGNINSLNNFPTNPQLVSISTVLGESDDKANGFAANTKANSDITWELTESLNFGIDLGLFKGALNFSADYFIKDTKDLIFELPVSSLEGLTVSPFINAGQVRNKGFEANLSYQENEGDFTYKVSANISKIENELVSLNNGAEIVHLNNIASLTPVRSVVGQPLFSFYAYETAGIFQSDADATTYTAQPTAVAGDLKIKDIDGNGVIDEDDRTFQGSALPDITYSLNGDFNYKNFDLRIFIQGTSGSKAFNGLKYTTVYPGQTSVGEDANLHIAALDTWSPTNTGASNFRLDGINDSFNSNASDFWIEDTSYLRLKNVTLGYTFSEIKGIDRLRIYAVGENLFTITDYSGLDPEVGLNNNGLDGGQYPLSKVFTIGINVGF